MVLSVAPEVEPRRVSVDAIEHWMIYTNHPDVGAILHVHAWVEGVPATEVNYPCGTEELAGDVARLLAAEPDPDHAVIGLRNHGITATGASLGKILDGSSRACSGRCRWSDRFTRYWAALIARSCYDSIEAPPLPAARRRGGPPRCRGADGQEKPDAGGSR